MFRISSTITAFAALATISAIAVPATAAVKIASALELELPDFMPELKAGTIVVLDQAARWPAAKGKPEIAS